MTETTHEPAHGGTSNEMPSRSSRPVEFQLNGHQEAITTDPLRSLASVVRDEFGLTGTKLGCEAGDCGACTVLVDGVAIASCLFPVAHARDRDIVTVEGLAATRAGAAVQDAFRNHNACQCGFCIPGILTSMCELVERSGPLPAADVVSGLAGNLCRCTGYESIVDAVLDAHQSLHEDEATNDA
jgi:aldehyde oxidoreductase